MSLNTIYVRTSLLAIFFITLHYTDDVIRKVRGMDQGGIAVLVAVLMPGQCERGAGHVDA